MEKHAFNLLINRGLLPVFVGLFWSGCGLHAAGHADDLAAWHFWTVVHTVVSLIFAGVVVAHVRGHWGWYRSLKSVGCKGRRRRMVLLLSLVFLLAAVSGLLLLLCGDGHDPHLGIFHYLLGLLFGVLGLLHLLKRLRTLFGRAKPKVGRSR